MRVFIRAIATTISDYRKYRKNNNEIAGRWDWYIQFYENYCAWRTIYRRRLYCDPIALLIIIGAAFLIGFSANTQKPVGCTYNATFDRWECCTEIVQTPHGAQCAIGARVTILNNQ